MSEPNIAHVALELAALSVRYYTDASILLASHEPDRCARWYHLRHIARQCRELAEELKRESTPCAT